MFARIGKTHPQCHYTLGYGQTNRGHEFTSTMQGHWRGKCFYSSQMHTPSGSRFTPPVRLLHRSRWNICGTFSSLGLPEVLVSDNATAFTSAEFSEFLQRNGVRHVRTPPYHPASNGLVERAVQSFKEGMKRIRDRSINTRLARYLFKYRSTPHTSTGMSLLENESTLVRLYCIVYCSSCYVLLRNVCM